MAAAAASFISTISPSLPVTHSYLVPHRAQFKANPCGGRKLLLLRVNCSPKQKTDDETQSDSQPAITTLDSGEVPEDSGVSANTSLYAGLGALGFLETSYLTYLKFTHSDAFCPVSAGGGSCGTILSSQYSVVFGVPLPLIGMLAYGAVAILGLQLGGKKLPSEIAQTDARTILLVTTASMAVASTYFLYILSTQFPGESCIYCLASAALSLCLLLATLKDFGSKELVLQLCAAIFVVIALNTSYSTSQPVSASIDELSLPFVKYEITTKSSPSAVSLARHLRSIGAKMYGAFWCSHCLEQKEMFGREAAEILDYVECFPNGYVKGTKIAKACADVNIEGFPTWVINGKVLSGELDMEELARASGLELEKLDQGS